MKTMKVNGMTMVIERSERARGPHGSLRRVFLTFPNVSGGLKMELTSFRGGMVEVYTANAEGLYMFRGSVRAYFPNPEGIAWLRAAWYEEMPSKEARASFEKSAESRTYEIEPRA